MSVNNLHLPLALRDCTFCPIESIGMREAITANNITMKKLFNKTIYDLILVSYCSIPLRF